MNLLSPFLLRAAASAKRALTAARQAFLPQQPVGFLGSLVRSISPIKWMHRRSPHSRHRYEACLHDPHFSNSISIPHPFPKCHVAKILLWRLDSRLTLSCRTASKDDILRHRLACCLLASRVAPVESVAPVARCVALIPCRGVTLLAWHVACYSKNCASGPGCLFIRHRSPGRSGE